MNPPPTTAELPHRPLLTDNTPADPTTTTTTTSPTSPSHSRTRRRLLDRKPRSLHPTTTPLNAKSSSTKTKRKLASTDPDPSAADETRRGRSITRSLSPLDVTNKFRRQRRRRSVSPSRGSRGSRSHSQVSGDFEYGGGVGMETPRAKRRRTLVVGRRDDGDVAAVAATEGGPQDNTIEADTKHTAPDKERSRSRLRARYRRMSEKASAEVRGTILSSDPSIEARDPENTTAPAVFDDEDNANNDTVISSAEKENATQDQNQDPRFRGGWGNIEREEWGVRMRNREEVAGKGPEGRGWLRSSGET
ncbi:MAG: hypothetical protein Q9160_001421 [Pyrenula sp. 1 TL-2023]